MWIFQNRSFLSIVQHNERPDCLLVRSRIKGDIEQTLPDAEVFEIAEADYRYRAVVTRAEMKAALAQAVDRVDYPNFKDSIPHDGKHTARKRAYMRVWQAMAEVFGSFGSRGEAS
jgi:hypothetical protein